MQTGALYIRVSTNEQTEFSPDAQKRRLLEYAKNNDILVSTEHIFIDEGISGRKAEKRPEFMRMIATAKKKPKPFDVILIHKIDRFARSREDSIVYKSLLRRECGIQVISITEHVDDDKFAIILEAMLEAMAEYYSMNLSDEVMKGMTEKALKGEYQAAAPFGYIMEDGRLIVDKEKSEIVKMIYDEFLNTGSSPFKISRFLNSQGVKTNRKNDFETRNITYILRNPTYCGYVRWNVTKNDTNTVKDESEWIIAKGDHEAIIDEEIFKEVQEKLKGIYKPRKAKPRDINKHWLSGLLKCSNCGKSLVYMKNHKREGFQCWLYAKGKCMVSHYVSEKRIVEAVIDSFQQVIGNQDMNYGIRNIAPNKNEIILLNQTLESIIKKEKRAKAAYLDGIDNLAEYKTNKNTLAIEKAGIQEKIKAMLDLETKNRKKEMLNLVQNAYAVITSDSCSKEVKSAAISSIITEIIYSKPNETIDIHYYY